MTSSKGGDLPPLTVTATGSMPRIRSGDEPPPGDWDYRPIVPERVPGGTRAVLRMVFTTLLFTSVALWWLSAPTDSGRGAAGVLIAGGRVAGLVGGYLLLTRLVLGSRLGWLERRVGASDLLRWQRATGGTLVLAVLAHIALITFGYAAADGVPVTTETRDLWRTFPAAISAYVAAGILVAVALLSLRSIRRRLPPSIRYHLDLAGYLVLLWSYGHQFAAGRELAGDGFGRWFWTTLIAVVIVATLWGRILAPLGLNLRHRLRVSDIVAEPAGLTSIYMTGRRLDLDARAGEFFRWRFMAPGAWWRAHTLALSAAPNGRWLRVTVSAGDAPARVRPGVRVLADGPWGIFPAERQRRAGAVLIAAGDALEAFRTLLEELPEGTIVLYRARSVSEVAIRDGLERLAGQRRAQLWYVLGGPDDPGPRRAFSAEGMREIAPDIGRRDVYLCGPSTLLDASLDALRRLGVPGRQIHTDPFEF